MRHKDFIKMEEWHNCHKHDARIRPLSTTFVLAILNLCMKYFRYYPWGMQLVLFLLMTFTFLSCVAVVTFSLFSKITGMETTVLSGVGPDSPYAVIRAMLGVQGAQNTFIFMLPAIAFAHLCHPRPMQYLGLRKPGKAIQPVLAVTLIAGAMPVLVWITHLISRINFGTDVKAAQLAQTKLMEAMMQMPSPGAFIGTLVVLALVPGIGEELFFRGILMRFTKKRSSNMIIPILFSAAVFSYAHSNVYGAVPIFIAGILLAVIYYLTGSIWCSILAHIVFNGSQIVLHYAGGDNPAIQSFLNSDMLPAEYVALGATVFGASLWLLIKNSTPLPDSWADDFTPAELEALKREKENGTF